ncbi:Putative glycoside hydrolase family 18, catalytic domain, glycosyl hydrolase family 18 (GH18) active [Septoria linicola]|uniref:chitinase n=1 Tax=Septoria linicola TaxID=215465 RepID=A0A9Q9AYK4_9PEZI|nr:Putative glycoside hydrolase family 18, catalytic domain, glycosyl hydrolase family 18 (GH18) active [Septoria linicola]
MPSIFSTAQRLLETCKLASVDVVNIGFVNQFPDNTGNSYPGTNFGNACWGDVYQNASGQDTQLLKTCPNIGPDVIACQQTYGKKIFLSLGGGYPTNYYFSSDTKARAFADFLWGAWGPVNSSWTGPRPWGNAVVDGFDFDIESDVSPVNRRTAGYTQLISRLKNTWYPTDTSKSYYISGAPQCILPDVHFTTVMNRAWFDFIWIQFYNTPQCSARAGINNQNGSNRNLDISYTNWTQSASLNTNVKYYIGLPAAPAAAASGDYLTLAEGQRTVQRFYGNAKFGGIMLWEATYAMTNPVCNKDQLTWYKDILNGQAVGRPATVTCPATTTTTRSVTTSVRTSTNSTRAPTTTTRAATAVRVATTSVKSSSSVRPTSTTASSRRSTTTSIRRKRAEATAFVTRIRARRAVPTMA